MITHYHAMWRAPTRARTRTVPAVTRAITYAPTRARTSRSHMRFHMLPHMPSNRLSRHAITHAHHQLPALSRRFSSITFSCSRTHSCISAHIRALSRICIHAHTPTLNSGGSTYRPGSTFRLPVVSIPYRRWICLEFGYSTQSTAHGQKLGRGGYDVAEF